MRKVRKLLSALNVPGSHPDGVSWTRRHLIQKKRLRSRLSNTFDSQGWRPVFRSFQKDLFLLDRIFSEHELRPGVEDPADGGGVFWKMDRGFA